MLYELVTESYDAFNLFLILDLHKLSLVIVMQNTNLNEMFFSDDVNPNRKLHLRIYFKNCIKTEPLDFLFSLTWINVFV